MKQDKTCVKSYDVETGIVKFAFIDGTERFLNVGAMPERMILQLALHGAEQICGDSAASAKEAIEQGKAASRLDFWKQQVERSCRKLEAGLWTERVSGPSQLARAIAEVLEGDPVAMQKKLDDLEAIADGEDQKAAEEAKQKLASYRKNAKVAAVVARMKREAAEKKQAALERAAEDADEGDLEDLMD